MKNIIFLSADQHHFGAFSSNGNKYCKTPNLDRLKKQALNFGLSYSASPLSGPARGSWFSGMMPSENGVIGNIYGDAIRKDNPMLGEWLASRSSYSNVYAGKWHVGDAPHMYNIRGFDVICSGINRNGIVGDASISVDNGRMVRSRQYKYITYRNDTCDHLYDMHADPLEMKNLIDDPGMRQILAKHKQWLSDWEKSLDKDPRVKKWFE